MNICLDCGYIFEDGEEMHWVEKHGFETSPYERFSGCPICAGAYTTAATCSACGGADLPEKLYGGVCYSCLKNTIDYESSLAYFEAHGYLEQFMFEKHFESTVPDKVSDKLRRYLREQFNRERAEAILHKTEFLKKCRSFILNDDGEIGRENYAAWLRHNTKATL